MDPKKVKSEPMELPLKDGSEEEVIDQAAKSKEDLDKNTEKELKAAAKVVDDINSAEADKPDLKAGDGKKKFRLKGVNEKLTLDETPDNQLNESEVDEALPKDLAKAYRNTPYKIGDGDELYGYKNIKRTRAKEDPHTRYARGYNYYSSPEVDFQNSEYTEITPEQALQYKKAGQADRLRIIFDNQLVIFKPDGKRPLYKTSRGWRSDHDLYKRDNGELANHSSKLTFKQIINRASKIYVADEKPIDRELRDKRAENPESIYYNYNSDSNALSTGLINNVDTRGGYLRNYEVSRASDYKKSLKDSQKRYNDAVKKLKELEASGAPESDIEKAKHDVNYYKLDIIRYQKNYNEYNSKVKDAIAFNRNISSGVNLRDVFNKFNKLRSDLKVANRSLNMANSDLDSVKTSGSPDVRRNRAELESANRELRNLKAKIARLEMYLESADEDNQAEIDKAAETVSRYQGVVDSINSQINNLLHKKSESLDEATITKPFSGYSPWSGAVDTFNKIKEAGKLDELGALIEDLYPEGIDETQLNDILWFESDYIFKELGIDE